MMKVVKVVVVVLSHSFLLSHLLQVGFGEIQRTKQRYIDRSIRPYDQHWK